MIARRDGKSGSVIVVGAGIVGLSVAYRLMRKGAKVTLFDEGRIGGGATAAAAGMLPPAIEAINLPGAHPMLARLLFAGAARWPSFVAELAEHSADGSMAELGYRQAGTVLTGGDLRATFDALAACVEANEGEFAGPYAAVMLGRNDLRTIEPNLCAHVERGIHLPFDAVVEPSRVAAALAHALIGGGAKLQPNSSVMSVQATPDRVDVILANGQIASADRLVVANGWSGRAGATLIPEAGHIIPIRGQILTVLATFGGPKGMVRAPGVYLVPRGDGRLDIGATSEVGESAPEVAPEAIIGMQRGAATIFPALVSAPALYSRVGIRPGSPDHAPMLGQSALAPSVFIALGLHRNGVLLAPFIADEIAAAVLSDGAPNKINNGWLSAFAPTRFTAH